jgi:hypothetical protein
MLEVIHHVVHHLVAEAAHVVPVFGVEGFLVLQDAVEVEHFQVQCFIAEQK